MEPKTAARFEPNFQKMKVNQQNMNKKADQKDEEEDLRLEAYEEEANSDDEDFIASENDDDRELSDDSYQYHSGSDEDESEDDGSD